MPYIGTSPSNGVRRVHTYTATASQTTFSGASSEGITLSYVDANYLDVFQNGVLLGSADYTSTSGTSVVLAQGASADDLIVIVVYDVFSVADTVSKTNGGSFDSGVTMSSTLAVTGNQTNTGNLTVNGAFTSQGIDDNANATAITVDDSERVMLGSTSTDGLFNSILQIEGTTSASGLSIHRSGSNPYLAMSASGGSSIGDDTAVSDGAGLGTIYWSGADGTDRNSGAAWIAAFVDGTPGSNDMPGRLAFATTDDGSTSPTERMRITNQGNVGIGTTTPAAILNVRRNSGTIAYFQNNAGTGAKIEGGDNSFSSVSDENKKENIVELNKQQSYDNIKNIRAVTYNFRDVVETNEDGTTTTYEDNKSRVGFIAQDWETNYSQLVNTDDNGVKSLLYTETTPVLLSALQKAQEKIEALEARITALENAE